MHLNEVDMARSPSPRGHELPEVLRLIPRRWRVFVFVFDRLTKVAVAMAPAAARLAVGLAFYIAG